jgi:hypothetical protein
MLKSKSNFTTKAAAIDLMSAMEDAIRNMIEEVRKPVDPEASGSARKAELNSIKQTAIDCKDLIVERQKLQEMIDTLDSGESLGEEKDYGVGFAEKRAKK